MIKKELDNLISPLGDEERLILAKEGFFVINTSRSGVYCPNGDLLYKKSTKKGGRVR